MRGSLSGLRRGFAWLRPAPRRAYDLDLIVHADDATLDCPCDHRSPASDRVHVLDAQQERRVDHPIRQRNVLIHLRDQSDDGLHAELTAIASERRPRCKSALPT